MLRDHRNMIVGLPYCYLHMHTLHQNINKTLFFFCSLVELHLSLNCYSSIPECNKSCATVKRLHFNGNDVRDWEEVEKLGKIFPNLETLIIMENPLCNVERNTKDSFLSLKCLSLTKTMLNSWEHIENLRNFVSLNGVKLIDIALLASYEEAEARSLLVARLPNIECLNGTPVSSTERENAERHFIRKFQTSNCPPARYHELVAIHGQLNPLAEVNMKPAECVEVLMHITGRAARLQSVSLEKTTWQFRKDMADLLQVHVSKISLFYHDKGCNQGVQRMIFQNRPFYRYGMKDGDEIFVDVHNSEDFSHA